MNNTIIDTTIYIGNIAIHEPVTVLTDFMVTILCLYFYANLSRQKLSPPSVHYWALFYLSMGISTLAGGCSHAFFQLHEGIAYKIFWLTMQLLNGVSVYAAQLATYNSLLQASENKKSWKRAYDIQLIVFIPAMFILQNFLVVIIDIALGLIPVMILHFRNSKKEQAHSWIAYGILISFLTAFIHLAKISLHAYFNYLDIAHILIIITLSIMYVGIKQQTKTNINAANAF